MDTSSAKLVVLKAGRWDLVESVDGTYYLIDTKTGGALKIGAPKMAQVLADLWTKEMK